MFHKKLILSISVLISLFSVPTFSADIKKSECPSYKWIINMSGPSSGKDVANLFKILSTDEYQPVLNIDNLKSTVEDDDNFEIRLIVSFKFKDVGIYTIDEAKTMAKQAIENVAVLSNTNVSCDGFSSPIGHLSGSN